MKAIITLLPGDGIGPEVVAEGRKVLDAVASRFGHTFLYSEALCGGIAIDLTGTGLPDETLGACLASDAVLLGAVGGPKWSDPKAAVRPEQGLLKLRKELGVFANLRPVNVLDALIDASPLRRGTRSRRGHHDRARANRWPLLRSAARPRDCGWPTHGSRHHAL